MYTVHVCKVLYKLIFIICINMVCVNVYSHPINGSVSLSSSESMCEHCKKLVGCTINLSDMEKHSIPGIAIILHNPC